MKADIITIGKRLVPIEQIALVEPFDAAINPELKSEKPFRARLVLINRESVLTETPPEAFADAYEFRWLAEDNVGVNPALFVKVEAFEATATFTPSKAYASRLIWSDLVGNSYSKLLLTPPDTFIAHVLRLDTPVALGKTPTLPARGRPSRKKPRRVEAARG